MLNAEQLYLKTGVRKTNDFISPKIIKIDSFQLPKNSTIISFLEEQDFPSSTNPLFLNSGRIRMYTSDELKNPLYEVKKNSTKVKSLIVQNKKIDDEFEYLYDRKKIPFTSPSRLMLFNYNALDSLYRYKHTKGSSADRTMNKFKTVSSCIDRGISTDRTRYLHVPLNTIIPPLKDFKRYIDKSNKIIEDKFPTALSRFMLDIYRLLHSEHKHLSMFNSVHPDEFSNIYIIFTFGNSMSMVSFLHLLSAVKEYEYVTGMNKMSGKSISKLFLLLIIKTIKSNPIHIDDAGKDIEITDGINVISKTDTGDYKVSDKNIEDILESEIIDTIEANDEETNEELLTAVIDKESGISFSNFVDDEVEETTEVTADNMLREQLELGDITESKYEEHKELIAKSKFKPKQLDPSIVQFSKEDIKLKDRKTVLDKSMLEDSLSVFDKKYIKEGLETDIDNSIYALTNAGIAVTDHKKIETSSVMGEFITHEIEIKTINGRKNKIKLVVPKVSEEGTFKISNNTYTMRKQKTDKPIRKIDANKVSLSSFYGKLFISKHNFKNNDAGYNIYKQLKKNSSSDDGTVKMLVYGESSFMDIKLPFAYTLIGRYTKSFVYSSYRFNFNYSKRLDIVKDKKILEKIESNKYIVVGKKGSKILVLDFKNNLYTYDGKYELLDDIMTIMPIDLSKLPIEFASIKLLKSNLPIVLLLSYTYGLYDLLKVLKAKYVLHPSNKIVKLEKGEYKVKFKDKILVLNRNDSVKNNLILGGLLSIKELKDIDIGSLSTKDGLINLIYTLGLNKRYSTEFKILNSMFIDPVTKDILKLMKEPTVFRLLLLRACELLTTDYYNHPNNINDMLIKGYDRMSGIIYKTLVQNVKQHENAAGLINNKISINPYEILNKMNDDSTVMLVEDNNPIAMLKQIEDVTMTGEFGRNKETLVGGSREFHSSEVGIFSESIKDSSDVGISAYLTASPTMTNLRGMVDVREMKDIKPVNMLSTTSLLTPANDRDDAKRANFASIQNSHVIPMRNSTVLPVRTGYESIIADRVPSKYATKAKMDGIVSVKSNSSITILYKDSSKETFKLKKWSSKEEAGYTYTHEMTTNLNKNDKVAAKDIVTYDKLFFEPDIFDKSSIVLKTGMLLRTQFVEKQTTYEDSVTISDKYTKGLSTDITKVRSVVIDRDTLLSNMVGIGDKVGYHSKLFTMSQDVEEITDGYELSKETIDILAEFKNNSPKAKIEGKIEKIVFYYNCELSSVNTKLRKLIEASDSRISGNTGQVNAGYSVNGNSLMDGEIELKIYIEGRLNAGIGDKLVFGNQLKCTIGDVFTNDTVSEDGRAIDAQFSTKSKDNRIVNSADLTGSLSTVLVALQENVVKEYFE